MIELEAFVTAFGFIALALFFGQIVCAGFVLPGGKPAVLRLAFVKSGLSSLLAFLFVSLLALLVQGAKIQHAMPSADLLWRYLILTQSGRVWLARLVYAVALAWIIWFRSRSKVSVETARWLVLLALPLVASRSLMSHAVTVREGGVATVAADAVHLIATAVWAGGLIAVWRALSLGWKRWQQPITWTSEIVDRFSRLALVSVAVIAATGFYQSWIHVGSLATLVATDYGKTLLCKLALFCLTLGLGALNFFSTKKRLRRLAASSDDSPSPRETASRRIALESCFAVLIFGVTGLLTVLPPGVHALHQAGAETMSSGDVAGPDGSQRFKLSEGASVKILSPSPEQVISGDGVTLKFNLTRGKQGQHVHAYVDGELMGMFESEQGTLNGIRPGRHVLELRVVAGDHQTELDATDHVEFFVK